MVVFIVVTQFLDLIGFAETLGLSLLSLGSGSSDTFLSLNQYIINITSLHCYLLQIYWLHCS